MKTILFTILIGLSLAFSAQAKRTSVNVEKSEFTWKAAKKIGGGHNGKLKLQSGFAELDGDKIKKGEFVIDMSSMTVEDLKGTWAKKFLDHVKSGDFFEVGKYKTAKLTIDKQIGPNEVSGTLTVKKKPQPVKVKFKRNGNKYSGTLVFDRTKHGITYGSKSFFAKLAADKIIENDITLDFNVVLASKAK